MADEDEVQKDEVAPAEDGAGTASEETEGDEKEVGE